FSSIVVDSRDNALLSHRGQRITFSPMIAGGFLGGDTQIYGLDLEGSQYFHLPKDLILLINGEIATVNQWGNGTEVPIFERLFLGGSNNLRGFPFREVGPQENGEPIGGQSMWRTTVELTFPVIAQGTFKIGTVDMQRAFKEYNKTKEAEAKINDAKNAARKEYDDRAQDYKKALDEINNLNKQLESPALSADKKTQTAKERDDK